MATTLADELNHVNAGWTRPCPIALVYLKWAICCRRVRNGAFSYKKTGKTRKSLETIQTQALELVNRDRSFRSVLSLKNIDYQQ